MFGRKKVLHCDLYLRMMEAYTDIQEFTITGLFLWTIFTISSLILAIQLEFVECIQIEAF